MLAEDFRFEFPVVSLTRADYLKAVKSFKLTDAFPDGCPHGECACHSSVSPTCVRTTPCAIAIAAQPPLKSLSKGRRAYVRVQGWVLGTAQGGGIVIASLGAWRSPPAPWMDMVADPQRPPHTQPTTSEWTLMSPTGCGSRCVSKPGVHGQLAVGYGIGIRGQYLLRNVQD